jgi:hypothetical protein
VLIESAAAPADAPLMRWAVWRRVEGVWRFAVLAGMERHFEVAGASAVIVHAVDRVGQLSPGAALRWP